MNGYKTYRRVIKNILVVNFRIDLQGNEN